MDSAYIYNTPIGKIMIVASEYAIAQLYFEKQIQAQGILVKETFLHKKAINQLEEYFTKKRKTFDLPLDIKGTEFQKKVWNVLLKIPYGQTKSYKEVAQAVGNEKACRAVGMANNRNKLPIFIPCHRVIGTDGKLIGFGSGLETKKFLLDLESSESI
jgi:methylated-DNA-[protein]-cysteine S-methyltransferase